MGLSIGDRIGEFTLPSHEGTNCSLSELLSGGLGLFLIFLRHLG